MTTACSLEDYRWLIGREAQPWLREALTDPGDTLTLLTRLRAHLAPQRAGLVVQQVELRRRAKQKFSAAGQMFFTPLLLEQASDEAVAGYKAARFPSIGRTADLCCGIGGDLLALACRGLATGVDRNPIATLLAEANCHALRAIHRVNVQTADALEAALHDCQTVHVDPDRRASGRRTTQVQRYEPGLEQLEQLRIRFPDMAIKLAPGTDPPAVWRDVAEWEWISRAGQCRQLVAWFGDLAQEPGLRRATLVAADATSLRTLVAKVEDKVSTSIASRLGRYLYEPDAAVLAAHLEHALAAEHDLQCVSTKIAYFTDDKLIQDPALAVFEILEQLPFDLKRLRKLLNQRGIGPLEIKKRGVAYDPEKLRRELGLKGPHPATLILTPHAGQTWALLSRRVQHPN